MTDNQNSKNHLAGEHPRGDKGQIILFVLFMLIWILDSFVFKYSTRLTVYVPLYVRLFLALLVIVSAGYFIKTGHTVLDVKQATPCVMNTGAFSFVRHPIYLGTMLFYKGMAISTLSLISLAFVIIIFAFYNYIAAYEERALENRFGKEYLEYKNRVSRWIPFKLGNNHA